MRRCLGALLASDLAAAAGTAQASAIMERVSIGPEGVPGDGDSGARSISSDGRFVAFASRADNRVSGWRRVLHGVPHSQGGGLQLPS
jgi:hypothetical protein